MPPSTAIAKAARTTGVRIDGAAHAGRPFGGVGRIELACRRGRGLQFRKRDPRPGDGASLPDFQAAEFFKNIPAIARKLDTLVDVGLGYIRLGQPATTFSGGEAQRIKLASELSRRSTGRTMYILDEPTTGLHSADVKRLLGILQQLVEGGNSMVIIEHNLDVIKTADHIIDMGPEGGNGGGKVIAEGTPEEVAKVKESFTGQYLRACL